MLIFEISDETGDFFICIGCADALCVKMSFLAISIHGCIEISFDALATNMHCKCLSCCNTGLL